MALCSDTEWPYICPCACQQPHAKESDPGSSTSLASTAAVQIEANQELNGVTSEGANMLPTRIIEDAFQHQYNKTLNFTDVKAGMQKVDRWYADRGIFGQVGISPDTFCKIAISLKSLFFGIKSLAVA